MASVGISANAPLKVEFYWFFATVNSTPVWQYNVCALSCRLLGYFLRSFGVRIISSGGIRHNPNDSETALP